MKTKEEVIKEAYGKYWEFVKDSVDENGWVKSIDFLMCNSPIAYESFHNKNGFFYNRPKSLHGIEKNNGWVKIQSENDLPKDEENLDYWVMEDEQIVHAKFMPESKRWYCDIDLNLRLFPSHYQPMVKPKLPIY